MLRLIITAVGRRAAQNQQLIPAVCNTLVQPLQSSMQAAGTTSVLRHLHNSSPLLSSTLSSVLTKEIKHEKAVYEKDEVVAQGPPAPFQLQTSPGDTAITLTRDFKGEKITVDTSMNMQDALAMPFGEEAEGDEDEDAEVDDAADITFNVSVTKGDQALVFECISDGTYVDIRHVSLEPASGVESETSYTGPVYAELDTELQGAFRDFLLERGINEDLGEYLRHLQYDKEQEEYCRWLEGVKSFVS